MNQLAGPQSSQKVRAARWPRRAVEPRFIAATPPGRLREILEASVGQVFGVVADDFWLGRRGSARVAAARQVAMYLANVTCQRSFTDVGRIFERDRTTVAHACGVVEDLRDDPRFDRILDLLEAIVLYRLGAFGKGGMG